MQTTRFARDIEKNFNFNFESTAFKLETKLLKRKLKKKKRKQQWSCTRLTKKYQHQMHNSSIIVFFLTRGEL